MRKNKAFKWVILTIFIVLIVSGGYFYKKNINTHTANSTNFIAVTNGDIENVVTAQGSLEPKDYVDVGAQVSGQLEKLYVEIGDQVKAGDLIAEINAEVFETKVAGDEAGLKMLQAQKLKTEAEIRQAEQKLARNEKLIKDKAISQEAFEDTQTALDISKASLMALEAQIEEAQSTLDGNKVNLNYTKIYAPIDGTVVSQSAKEGETLNANQTTPTIIQIANLNIMTVNAQVTEADITNIKAGMAVYFTTLGSQNRRWQGVVRQVLPTPEILNDVVLYNVLADVENKDGQLMNGMTTQMFFVLGQAKGVPIIPTNALLRKDSKSHAEKGDAYLVNVKNGNQTKKQTVFIGISDRSNAQVLSGLSLGDEVALPMPLSQQPNKGSASGGRARTPRL